MRIGIFEGRSYFTLQPLTYLRPVFDLRCGIFLLREKIENQFTAVPKDYFIRNDLQATYHEQYPQATINLLADDDFLFLNGSALFSKEWLNSLQLQKQSHAYTSGGHVIAAIVMKADVHLLDFDKSGLLQFDKIESGEADGKDFEMLNYPWDFIHHNPAQIEADFTQATGQIKPQSKLNGVHQINESAIRISSSARIDPGVVLDASDGPIFIDDQAHIYPQATIIGPAYIGKKSTVKIGAKIYEGTSIGEVCKVGGEIEESIIHSYSNKQHDGFLGHAYLGQWVNLGADTNNSDLKNNYSSVRVSVNGNEVDSGSMFVGLTMGDHSKSAINTMFNTGTVVGIMANVFGANFPPKWIPDFTWGGSEKLVEFQIDKAIQIAHTVMKRRDVTLGSAEEDLIRKRFKDTAVFRKKAGII